MNAFYLLFQEKYFKYKFRDRLKVKGYQCTHQANCCIMFFKNPFINLGILIGVFRLVTFDIINVIARFRSFFYYFYIHPFLNYYLPPFLPFLNIFSIPL